MVDQGGNSLINLINSVTISPEDARLIADRALLKARSNGNERSDAWARAKAADIIISRYARMTGLTGAASALPAVIPGIGTVITITGGVTADTIASLRFQIDMCKCLAVLYGYEIESQDAQYLSILLALFGSLEKASATMGAKLASQAGVRMIRMYLRGATLVTIKQAFRRVGVVFARKSLEKAIPVIGVPVSGATSYAFTRYVGWEAKKWMDIDASGGGAASQMT